MSFFVKCMFWCAFISELFPSPLSIARQSSAVPLQPNNTSVWSRLRAMNVTVSNFMLSTKFLPTKQMIGIPEHDAEPNGAEVDSKHDIGRCVSMPNMKRQFQSELLQNGDKSFLCETWHNVSFMSDTYCVCELQFYVVSPKSKHFFHIQHVNNAYLYIQAMCWAPCVVWPNVHTDNTSILIYLWRTVALIRLFVLYSLPWAKILMIIMWNYSAS